MSDLYENYQAAKDTLFDSLRVIDTYIDGLHKPQTLLGCDWTEIETTPGIWIKNITLLQPANFSLALVHAYKGAKNNAHQVSDNVELHLITGKLMLNNLELKAGDRIRIPANILYSFDYVEDTYLTAKFIPVDLTKPTNFIKYGCNFSTANSTITPQSTR